MKLKHAKAGGKIIALFTAAFFIGHFIGYAAEKMNPPAVPTAADGNWGLSFQEDGKIGRASCRERVSSPV